MPREVPERNKKPGLFYAWSEDGLELPVIDVTHPAFALEAAPEEIARVSADSLKSLQASRGMPQFVLKMMASGSYLTRELFSSLPYLTGMTTYIQKLGPENLGSYASAMDRTVAGAIAPLSMRLRLQQMAALLAEGLEPALRARPAGPLHIVNIGGGAGSDSLNALIVLRRRAPELLEGRTVRLHLLDLDEKSTRFGARCLEALQAPQAPLAGLNASIEAPRYDWSDPAPLRALLAATPSGAVVGVTSEGGLFEYGDDATIAANLAALKEATPDDCVVAGSVTRDAGSADPSLRLLHEIRGIPPRLLGLAAFEALAARSGWSVQLEVEGNPFYHIVGLEKLSRAPA